MKRRRHVLVELSSTDDSDTEDFVIKPKKSSKLKIKGLSIVVEKKHLSESEQETKDNKRKKLSESKNCEKLHTDVSKGRHLRNRLLDDKNSKDSTAASVQKQLASTLPNIVANNRPNSEDKRRLVYRKPKKVSVKHASSEFDNSFNNDDSLLLPIPVADKSQDSLVSSTDMKSDADLPHHSGNVIENNVPRPMLSESSVLPDSSNDIPCSSKAKPKSRVFQKTSIAQSSLAAVASDPPTQSSPPNPSQTELTRTPFCQICMKNITSYDESKRKAHINRCCNMMERFNNFGENNVDKSNGTLDTQNTKRGAPHQKDGAHVSPPQKVIKKPSPQKGSTLVDAVTISKTLCPLCSKTYSKPSGLKRHLVSCCIKNSKCFETVTDMVFTERTVDKDLDKAISMSIREGRKRPRRGKTKAEKVPSVLLLEKDTTHNRAQNKLLDLISDDVFPGDPEISCTPALAASKLTTYRSKRNSIWNVAGSSVGCITSVLKHDNSIIQTQKHHNDISLPDVIPQSPCLHTSSLPSSSDISQITQFLENLGNGASLREHLASISPIKKKPDRQSTSPLKSSEDETLSVSSAVLPHVSTEPDMALGETDPTSSAAPPMDSSPVCPSLCLTNSLHKPRAGGMVFVTGTNISTQHDDFVEMKEIPDTPADLEIQKHLLCDQAARPELPKADRSPNTSDISDVDVGSLDHRTPARNESEMVSSLHSDSNIDLFSDEKSPEHRTEETVEFDRSLLNVSPITETDPTEIRAEPDVASQQPTLPSEQHTGDNATKPLPIYRKKTCTSTTTNAETSPHAPPLRNFGTQCERVQARSVACNTTTLYAVAQVQADYVLVNRGSNTQYNTVNQACNTEQSELTDAHTQASSPERQLYTMILGCLRDSTHSDVTVKCSDGTLLPAHRIILHLGCPKLLKVSDEPIDMSAAAVKLLLEYIYTRQVRCAPVSDNVLEELERAAQKFDLPELRGLLLPTLQLKFRQSCGDTVHLNLSTQDIENLSQQLDIFSSQRSDMMALTAVTPRSDMSLTAVIPRSDMSLTCLTQIDPSVIGCTPTQNIAQSSDSTVHPGILEDHKTSHEPTNKSPNFISHESSMEVNDFTNLSSSSFIHTNEPDFLSNDIMEFGDLPCSGVEFSTPKSESPRHPITDHISIASDNTSEGALPATQLPTMMDEAPDHKKVDQLLQDVEFMDLVNSLDDSIASTSYTLGPLHISPRTPAAQISVYEKTPRFEELDTPQICQAVDKFGLKKLTKKRAITKLREIHRFTNKKFYKCPDEATPSSSTKQSATKRPRAAKQSATKHPTAAKQSATKRPTAAKQSATKRPTAAKQSATKGPTAAKPPVKRTRVDSTESSGSDRECPVGDITVSEKVGKSKKSEIFKMIRDLIVSDEELYLKVLQYEPIDIMEIKDKLSRKTSPGLIAEVLDQQGVTFIQGRSGAPSRTRRKKG